MPTEPTNPQHNNTVQVLKDIKIIKERLALHELRSLALCSVEPIDHIIRKLHDFAIQNCISTNSVFTYNILTLLCHQMWACGLSVDETVKQVLTVFEASEAVIPCLPEVENAE